jgi:hypothetical protein
VPEDWLPLLRSIAEAATGSPVAGDAAADVRAVEGLIAKFEQAKVAEFQDWLAKRLHPGAVAG